ncbi:MAG: hypothetical protein GF388_09020 [Candidatus Aegiribacteria sp.]|nr:hypothetical protein [Candidatus Aegiribacteria sp.]MBD3295202.1 hypothetical protein [Candidatus Fermentibacteria bacterium]
MTSENADKGKLVSVLEASDELQAITVRSFLESQGIEAAIRSRQIPMYDGIAKIFNPVWGYVVVMEEDREKAEELISEYLEALEEEAEAEEDL